MPSIVAGQGSEGDILQQAIALELDCVAATRLAHEKLNSAQLRAGLAEFAAAHEARLGRLRQRLRDCQLPDTGANKLTEALNRGKVVISAWVGDQAILRAVHNNARDTHEAYAEVAQRVELEAASRALFRDFAADASAQLRWFSRHLPAASG